MPRRRLRYAVGLVAIGVTGLALGSAPSTTQVSSVPSHPAAKFRGDPDGNIQMAVARAESRIRVAPSAAQVNQRQSLVNYSVPGTAGSWAQYGEGPLLDNTSDYTPIDAIPTMSGRVQDFAVDPANSQHIWVAIGASGIFETTDAGIHWRPISDSVPNSNGGAVAYSASHGGTLFDGTGDSGYGFLGLGVYRTVDDGVTWQHASGVPDQAITFRIAVDPTNPDIIYAATSKGLFRSINDGISFVNTVLPTGSTDGGTTQCAGNTTAYKCVYDNWITDVVVRAADSGGADKGGEVLAASGWFRGQHQTVNGWNNSVSNGLYGSATGAPGTFTNLNASSNGFTTSQSHIGHVVLGAARGAQQNHDVVWALVSDAQAVNSDLPIVDPGTASGSPLPPCAVAGCYNTVLDNLYMSTDFGKTWTKKLADPHQLQVCGAAGTDQCGAFAAAIPAVSGGYGPGVQAWYNHWILPDPTQQDASGIPTRVAFGLEEVWLIDGANQTGPVTPHVIGRYFGNGFCPESQTPVGGFNTPVCPAQPNAPTTTHPDQHGAVWVPDGSGGVTLVVGNDGGVYAQHQTSGGTFDNAHWGNGLNNLHTELSYTGVIAKDGVAYSGLQDNGEMKTLTDGRQVAVYGGDGGYSAVEPDNSNVVYEEYVLGAMSRSIDGGKTWKSIAPSDSGFAFTTPFSMDPKDPKHLIMAGENVWDTTSGPDTTAGGTPAASTDWASVYDTGTGNSASATAVDGKAEYVGFCGACYIPSTVASAFHAGIATNVGGSQPGDTKSAAGWHTAAANGLPQREIKWIQIDASDPNTIYVALGDYDAAYRLPGALGDDTSRLGKDRVYKSTDHGENFTDISGNLPDLPTYSVIQRGNQLIAGTSAGVYISNDLNGSLWAILGNGHDFPIVQVTSLQMKPGDDQTMLVATYGRGLWTYNFAGTPVVVPESGRAVVLIGVGMAVGLAMLARASRRRQRIG